MAKDPAVLFYTSDLISGTALMNMEQRGKYITLLCLQHQYGYISEHHSFGQKSAEAGDYAEDLAASMLATTLGIPFDVDSAWNEKKQIFETESGIIETRNVTATCKGKEGYWATAVAAVMFVP